MNETIQPFLDEGLNVYARARATQTFFEQEIGKLLQAAVERRSKWQFLESYKISPAKSDKSAGQIGYWMAISVEGLSHRKERVAIDCGIWWNALKTEEPIIYASFVEEPKRALKFSWKKERQRINSFDRWNRTFLYLAGLKSAQIEDALNQVLDELLKQLK